jgi:hypothetical protein
MDRAVPTRSAASPADADARKGSSKLGLQAGVGAAAGCADPGAHVTTAGQSIDSVPRRPLQRAEPEHPG